MTYLHRRRAVALGLPLLMAACGSGEPRRAGPLDAGAQARLAAVKLDPVAAMRILNAYRASRGLGAVALDPLLTAMAQRQADAMAAANTLSHDAAGGFVSRLHAAGLDAARAAENLGAGYVSTEEAFAGWKSSAGHDANLRLAEATRFGIALSKDAQTRYRTWWALVIAGEPERQTAITAGPIGYFGSNIRR